MFRIFLYVVILSTIQSCVSPNQTFEKIPPGIWRATLLLDRTPVQTYGDDRDIEKNFDVDSELPFNFEVVYDTDEYFHLIIHNDTERIKVQDISFGRDRATGKDTIIIDFPVYDTQIRAIYEDGVMEGDWLVNYKDNYKIPFKAVHGNADRFTMTGDNDMNVAGKWSATFEIGSEDEYRAIGIFAQRGDTISGTFLTETGDYRYLSGKVVGKKMYLSTFDGAHAFLFSAKMLDDNVLSGTFRSGSQYTTNWEGIKNDNASLGDSYTLTKNMSETPLRISFPNTSGEIISIDDEAYKEKVKIVQIMGTWCPNCMDETLFLKEYFAENPSKEIAVITVGFERYKEEEKSIASLRRFKDRMNIDHEVLYGGYYDKKNASEKIPQLNKIMSYPTMIITDKKNNIVKIHTGFSGPATPEFENFKMEFKKILDEALSKS